jgi:hypothetical protein
MSQPNQTQFPPDASPKPRVYFERIGDSSWELHEAELDVFEDVQLWHENPRLLPHLPAGGFASDEDLEAALRLTSGYDNLKKSIATIGQMEPVYAWRKDDQSKYLVIEGATRVSILRELARKEPGGIADAKRRIKAKVLPPHFGEKERVILLARIHVRGSGVRSWGRYVEAKFIHDNVAGAKALMSVSEMANYMEKSVSWVLRLREAYQFAMQFVQYVDDPSAEKLAADQFSALEEISKVASLGPRLRDYEDKTHDALRAEVFEMVRNKVFKEYRDARFLKEFHDDPEKWAQLKTGEENIAHRLAAEIKHTTGGVKAKISSLPQAVERALQRDDHGLDDEDAKSLRDALSLVQQGVHGGVAKFRLDLKNITSLLENASMADVKSLTGSDLEEFKKALEYFDLLIARFQRAA